MSMFILFVYFLRRKEVQPVFNSWLSLLFNPWSSQGIYLRHRIYLHWRYPVQKFHASSCYQTKVKVEGQFCPIPLSSPFPPYHTPKKWFQIPTRNRVTNIIIDEANLERLKASCAQTLLRQYATCEHNSIDDFAKLSDENIIVFHNINIL